MQCVIILRNTLKYEHKVRLVSKQHARSSAIIIPLISSLLIVVLPEYFHSAADNEQGVLCVKSEFPPKPLAAAGIISCWRAWTSSQELFCSKYFTLEIASSGDGHIIFPEILTIPSVARLVNAGTHSQEIRYISFKH